MGVLLSLSPALAETGPAAARLAICLQPGVAFPMEALPPTAQELRLYSSVLGAQVEFDCGAKDALKVILEQRPSFLPADVLGAAPTSNGRVLPELHIFTDAVTAMLPVRSVRSVSRALALVIAHECAHFVRQQFGHEQHGVQMRAFTREDLERGAEWWTQRASLESSAGQ